jgi:Uncharacterized conserved protein
MTADRVMIFIDGQNLLHGAKNFGEQVDCVKLREELTAGRKLKRAYYYGSIPSNPDNDARLRTQIDKQVAYYHYLEYVGFKTSIIPLKKRYFDFKCDHCNQITRIEKSIEKGVDIALVSDMLSLGKAGAYDVAVLVSGDYDYHKAIDKLQRSGIIVEIAYFRKHGIGKDMIRLADRFINLEDVIDKIKKT